MSKLVAIMIGLAVVGVVIGILLSMLVRAGELLGSGARNLPKLPIAIFGRRRSRKAKLTSPHELFGVSILEHRADKVVQDLKLWNPKPVYLPHPSWPKWETPWIEESAGSYSATIDDIESLFRPLGPCEPPYELIDEPLIFPTPDFPDLKEEEPPPEPPRVQEIYPPTVISLPLWPRRLEFLNRFVKAAHAELIERHRQLELKQANFEEKARVLNQVRRIEWERARARDQTAIQQFRKDRDAYLSRYKAAKAAYQKARDADIGQLGQAKTLIAKGDPAGVVKHFDLALRRLSLPSFIPRQWMIRFEPETKMLLVEHRFPETARLELFKIVEQSHGPVMKPAAQSIRKKLIPKIQPALCLQLARTLAESDSYGLVDAIAVNGWIDFFDKATGVPKRAYCASLVSRKEALLALQLETADLVAAFNSMRGAKAGETYETAPVMPSLRLQTDDPRFIESRDTIQKMAKGENLAAMDWGDFEHLVRELFEREFASIGAEVKITRVSRDQGVDAVIFDPDPLRGGKIVIQAKRYTIPVGVSAVRDLYGTVLNEGANTGILVTTSHYGSEAYEFAQNKPLKLINGAQLLGLLEKAGYRFRIDLAEARALASKANN